jgi:hypothetical protein
VIPRNVRLSEAPSHAMPVILYDVASRGAQAYLALAEEVIRRNASTQEESPKHKMKTSATMTPKSENTEIRDL